MTTETPMQLGMVGLGRMGAGLVRRLMADGHRCVGYDVNADAVKAVEADGAGQLLLHVQGLVLRSARQRNHRRSEQVGLLQHALPEHRSRRQRELCESDQPDDGVGK